MIILFASLCFAVGQRRKRETDRAAWEVNVNVAAFNAFPVVLNFICGSRVFLDGLAEKITPGHSVRITPRSVKYYIT